MVSKIKSHPITTNAERSRRENRKNQGPQGSERSTHRQIKRRQRRQFASVCEVHHARRPRGNQLWSFTVKAGNNCPQFSARFESEERSDVLASDLQKIRYDDCPRQRLLPHCNSVPRPRRGRGCSSQVMAPKCSLDH